MLTETCSFWSDGVNKKNLNFPEVVKNPCSVVPVVPTQYNWEAYTISSIQYKNCDYKIILAFTFLT